MEDLLAISRSELFRLQGLSSMDSLFGEPKMFLLQVVWYREGIFWAQGEQVWTAPLQGSGTAIGTEAKM